MNLQQEIDSLYDFIKEIEEAQKAVDELQAERRRREERLMSFMQESGVTLMRGSKATVSVSETTRASIEDYDKAIAFIKRGGHWQLFERRISSKAYSELMEGRSTPIPGLREYKQPRLNVRKV